MFLLGAGDGDAGCLLHCGLGREEVVKEATMSDLKYISDESIDRLVSQGGLTRKQALAVCKAHEEGATRLVAFLS